jgi:stress response protein YsnF
MLTEREVSASIGGTAYSSSGDKIGTVEHYFVDDRTGAPSWVAVTTGLFGTRHSIVPATEATFADGALRVPVTVDAVKSAPHLQGDHLDPEEEARLRRHYGLDTGLDTGLGTVAGGAPTWTPTAEGLRPPGAGGDEVVEQPTAVMDAPLPPPPAAYEGPPPATDGGMVRNEEQLRVGTERVAATRVRLVKYVVTEEVQITVPIRREEIRVEEVPIDAVDEGVGESLTPSDESYGAHSGTRAGSPVAGTTTGGLPDEIILHTERPIVSVEVVPRERVRLRTELVRGQETVTEQVQREQIVVDETPTLGRVSPR